MHIDMCIGTKNLIPYWLSSTEFLKNEMGAILVSIQYQVVLVYNTNDDTNIDTRVQPIYT
jgi:hypothetical protein